ncbi:DMT family transporter [Rhodophyticola sp. CCM32]|uniref:DMT family transporter n=1 Tax=Rhodophyticola sp. CCM32 TaxID=2916397 RepID=UPI00107FC3AF|nr:DMT family transporter [Rhodophyticola sp. CCM32]QBY00742.1 DMT family transporter [Rhodophyticola sp. CCM32]
MQRKDNLDAFGVVSLTGFALLLAVNQVVIKVSNDGLQPVFLAGLRSLGGAVCILAWMRLRGLSLRIAPGTRPAGLLVGVIFAAEFIFLFLALDMTTVTRLSVIFYTMPVWMTLGAHLLLPGEKITPAKAIGLILAVAGMAWAIFNRGGPDGAASLTGDLFALAASICWAAVALCTRATALKQVRPEMQLLWQLVVSTPILLLAALFFGPLLREPSLIHWLGLGFQIVAVVSAGFLFWFWLLGIYPAASVASFSFLSPIFGVILGWALLGEHAGPEIWMALALVCAGLVLINRPSPHRPRPADDPTPSPPRPRA